MDRVKAKLKYLANTFEVIEKGDYVESAVSKKKILDKVKCKKVEIEDKTFLHKKHKNFNPKKFHLKIKIKSVEL